MEDVVNKAKLRPGYTRENVLGSHFVSYGTILHFEFKHWTPASSEEQLEPYNFVEARMVSPAMGAAMMGTMYFLWASCAQHCGGASDESLICVSLRSYRALGATTGTQVCVCMVLHAQADWNYSEKRWAFIKRVQ